MRQFSTSTQEYLFSRDFQGLSLHRGIPVSSARLFVFQKIYLTAWLSEGKMLLENLMLGSVTKCRAYMQNIVLSKNIIITNIR